jgi:hypothetical protein
MNELEQVYNQGLADYETALLKQAMMEEEAVSQAAQFEEAARRHHADIASAAYLQGLADCEGALAAQSQGSVTTDELRQEEAYQMGVALVRAQEFIKALESSARNLPSELKEAHEKGRSDCKRVLELKSEKAKAPAQQAATRKK